MQKIKLNKIKAYYILSLAILWLFLTTVQIVINDGSFTVISKKYSKESFADVNYNIITKNDKRNFEFRATQDNLGIIYINFDTFDRMYNGNIYFRIKEKGKQSWYKEEKVNTAAFYSLNLYPFGFPIIPDSKNKVFIVEIESIDGHSDSAVALKQDKHILIASYQFDKSQLIHDQQYLYSYLIKKTVHSIENNYLAYTSFVYLYPIVFYFLWMFFSKLSYNETFFIHPIFLLISITVITDIFVIYDSFDLIFLIVSVLWSIFIVMMKEKSIHSYKAASILFGISISLYLLQRDNMVEKAAAWAFLALTVGVIINLYELRKDSQRAGNKQ